MPILYDEFGIESMIPADKRELYGGVEPATTRPVPEAAQAAAYRRAIQLAYCQSNVAGMLLFHTHDEPGRPGWQSGLVYADGTPKTSLEPVRAAMESAGSGRGRPVPGGVEGVGCLPADRPYDLAPMRARVHLPGPAAAPAAALPPDRGDRQARPPASASTSRSPPGPSRRAGSSSRSPSWTRRGRDGPSSGSARPSWCVPPRRRALAGCGGDDGSGPPFLVGAVDDRVRHDAGRAPTSCTRPASPQSGSRASGSRESTRRRRRRSRPCAASSMAPAAPASSSPSTTPAPARPR